jgi:hypothetical protein
MLTGPGILFFLGVFGSPYIMQIMQGNKFMEALHFIGIVRVTRYIVNSLMSCVEVPE